MNVELIANIVVAVLLAVMIGYCFVLNKRLAGMRKGQTEMVRLIASLNQASENAQSSVQQLKTMGQEAEHALKMEVSQARSLADELSLITEAGNNLADRIEYNLDQQKKVSAGGNSRPVAEDDWLLAEDLGTQNTGAVSGAEKFSEKDILKKLRRAR